MQNQRQYLDLCKLFNVNLNTNHECLPFLKINISLAFLKRNDNNATQTVVMLAKWWTAMFISHESIYEVKLTVPLGPTSVATHLKRLSPSGNADTPGSPDICKPRTQYCAIWKQVVINRLCHVKYLVNMRMVKVMCSQRLSYAGSLPQNSYKIMLHPQILCHFYTCTFNFLMLRYQHSFLTSLNLNCCGKTAAKDWT